MDADQKLRKRVGWLNTAGGFNNAVSCQKVQEAAWGLEITVVMRILKELEEKKDEINDPTAWATSKLRKQGGGQGGGGGMAPPALGMDSGYGGGGGGGGGYGGGDAYATEGAHEDQQVRKKIGWLNNQGGFDGQINYSKIIEAAKGLEYSKVLDMLGQLEQKRGEVKDPTAWVCSALRKAGGGSGGGGGGFSAPPMHNGFGGGMPMPMPAPAAYGYPPAPAPGGGGMDADTKLSKRITWLNSEGGFGGAIDHDKIYAAAKGLEISVVMKVLKDLEEKQATVKDPNAYAGAALRKLGGGGGGGGGGGMMGGCPPPPMPFAAPPAFGGGGGGGGGWGGGGDAQAEDQKVRKKIGWLNNAGGWDGAIHYQKIIDAARGLEYSEVMRILKNLEEKDKGSINDPTGWVCAALRKSGGGGGGGGGMGGMPPMPAPAYGGGGGYSMGGGGYPAALDAESDTKLRKRIGWLNKDGGFDGALNYQKVAEAAAGVDIREVMEVLKDVEGKKDQVKDPTAYTTAALRKRRGGGGMPPAKRMRT